MNEAEAAKRRSSLMVGPKDDKIEDSISKRISEGNSITHICDNNDLDNQKVFELKVKGALPELNGK